MGFNKCIALKKNEFPRYISSHQKILFMTRAITPSTHCCSVFLSSSTSSKILLAIAIISTLGGLVAAGLTVYGHLPPLYGGVATGALFSVFAAIKIFLLSRKQEKIQPKPATPFIIPEPLSPIPHESSDMVLATPSTPLYSRVVNLTPVPPLDQRFCSRTLTFEKERLFGIKTHRNTLAMLSHQGTLRLFDRDSLKMVRSFDVHSQKTVDKLPKDQIAFALHSKYVFVSTAFLPFNEATLTQWQLDGTNSQEIIKTTEILALCHLQGDAIAISYGALKGLTIYYQKMIELSTPETLTSLHWIEEKEILLGGSEREGKLFSWNFSSSFDEPPLSFEGKTPYSLSCLTFIDGERPCVFGGEEEILPEIYPPLTEYPIYVWDFQERKLIDQLKGHESWITSLHHSEETDHLYSASHDGTLRVWNWQERSCLLILRGHLSAVSSLAENKDSILSCSEDGTLRCWDKKKISQHTDWGNGSVGS